MLQIKQRMKQALFTTVSLFLTLSSFAQKSELGWLEGKWKDEENKSIEEWIVKGDSLIGKNYSFIDPTEVESIRIIRKGKDFFYVPRLEENNGDTFFKIISLSKTSFTAYNPEHDFPKTIKYKLIDAQHLQATIGDEIKTIKFYFVKSQ